ncbi:amino acid permease [archaeon]|jgi:tyrosine-specific transport protein|nr:amino acid permease [archaeon]MBT3450914.1 amino acid permease [archaeon]MBT6869096.1 amino acid permease [archaeon]MBT7193339.1 amino acid permease [archaeon]MBT7380347.1 amino acid permease [archaeon]
MAKKRLNLFGSLLSKLKTKHQFLVAVATLAGTIVGAGILGIPYVLAKGGFIYGSLLIILLGAAFVLLNLYSGEMILRTKEKFQLTGYIGKYLGKYGKWLMTLAMVFGIYGALTAFLIGEGEVLKSIFGEPTFIASLSFIPISLITILQTHFYSILFFIIASLIIYRGVKAAGEVELVIISILILIVFLIGLFSLKNISVSNFNTFNPAGFFLPYGVILFSFMGIAAVPEINEQFGKNKKDFKSAIIVGSIIPLVLYFLFSLIVVGIVGLENFELLSANERIATVALSVYSGSLLGLLANIFAVFTMFTTFLTLSIALSEVYEYDYKINKNLALVLTLSVPMILSLGNFTTFISALAFTGCVTGGTEAILIILAYWKAKKLGNREPEYSLKLPKFLSYILIVLFVVGIVYKLVEYLI